MIGSKNIGVLGQLPKEKLLSNPKNNPNPNLNHNWGTIFLGDNCPVSPNPKTNPNLDQNPNPKRGAIFLGGGGGGGQLSGYLSMIYHSFSSVLKNLVRGQQSECFNVE